MAFVPVFAAGRLSGEWPKTQVRGGHLTLAAWMSPGFEWGNPLYRNVTCRQLRRGCLERCRNMIGEVGRVEPGHHPGENIHGVVSSEDQHGQALKDNDEHRQPGEPASAQASDFRRSQDCDRRIPEKK